MNWILVLILIGKMAGSVNTITTESFESEEACRSVVMIMEQWSEEARQMYPTDTPYVHAYCVPVGDLIE